jgi:hypothetical protein
VGKLGRSRQIYLVKKTCKFKKEVMVIGLRQRHRKGLFVTTTIPSISLVCVVFASLSLSFPLLSHPFHYPPYTSLSRPLISLCSIMLPSPLPLRSSHSQPLPPSFPPSAPRAYVLTRSHVIWSQAHWEHNFFVSLVWGI